MKPTCLTGALAAGMLFAVSLPATAFSPQWQLAGNTTFAVTANLAWDINRVEDPSPGMTDDEGWRRREVGLSLRKNGVFDVNAFYDLHSEQWIDTALRIETRALFGRDLGKVRIGNAKLHAGLEGVAANRHAVFMESSAASQVFYPGARAGVTWTLSRPDFLLDVGAYGRDFNDANAGGTQLVRAAWTPRTPAGGQGHFGLAVMRDTPSGTVDALGEYRDAGKRWATRGIASLNADRLVDTGTLSRVDVIDRQNLQAMWLQGPVWVHGEYFFQQTDRAAGLPGYDSHGGFVAAGWTLNATPRRLADGMLLNPRANAGEMGAELVGRYSKVDLDADGISGGQVTEWTVGVNAYLGPKIKVQANYTQSRARRLGVPQTPQVLQLRTQFYF